jgi:hypothetical protein
LGKRAGEELYALRDVSFTANTARIVEAVRSLTPPTAPTIDGDGTQSRAITLRILPTAARELERLDKPVARRSAERIQWLAANPADIRPEPSTGDLAGLYKFRVGDTRVAPGGARFFTTKR